MNRRDDAILICRSLALWNAVKFVLGVPGSISFLSQPEAASVGHLFDSVIAVEFLHALSVLALWFLAVPIADRMVRGTSGVAQSASASNADIDMQQIVVSGIGLFLLSFAVPALISEAISMLVSWNEQHSADLRSLGRTGFVQQLATCALGLWLFLGSRSIAEYWRRARTVGLDKT